MQLFYGMNDYEVKIIPVDSKRELLDILLREFDRYVLLENSDFDSRYLIASYYLSGSMKKFGVGLLVADSGHPPLITSVPYRNMSLLGYNCTLSLLDLEIGRVVFKQEFCTPLVFYKCYPDNILVLTEDCIYLLSYNGERQNSYLLDDVLQEFEFSFNTLSFNTCSNPEKRVITLTDLGFAFRIINVSVL